MTKRVVIGVGTLTLLLAVIVTAFLGMKFSAHASNGCAIQNATAKTCFNDIQSAVNAANAGDTIKVGAGTYAGGITINKAGLKLIGTSSKNAAQIVGTGATGPKFGITISGADNVVVQGFTISGFSGQTDASGIFIGGNAPGDTANRANNATISRNVIHDNGNGVYMFQSNGDKITNNKVYHNLNFSGSEGTGITSFNAYGTAATAVNAAGYSGKNLLISGNTVYNNDRLGIFAGACTESFCQGDGVHVNISGTVISDNKVTGNGSNTYTEGIGLLDASGGTISNNKVNNNNYNGILINYSDTVAVTNNKSNDNNATSTTFNGYNAGITVNGSKNVTAQGNTTDYNGIGIYVAGSDTSTFSKNSARKNTILDLSWDNVGVLMFSNNTCDTASPSKAVWNCK